MHVVLGHFAGRRITEDPATLDGMRVMGTPQSAEHLLSALEVEEESRSARLLGRPLAVRHEAPEGADNEPAAGPREAVQVPSVTRPGSFPAANDLTGL